MYLYFYVGEFTQTAIENTAGLNAGLFSGKADTDLGNVSAGIDFVVESQFPTAQNNYTWYRKYKSGWVEQGGQQMSGKGSVSLPITMADAYYTALCTNDILSSNYHTYALCIASKTIAGFEILSQSNPAAPTAWQVSGMAAS